MIPRLSQMTAEQRFADSLRGWGSRLVTVQVDEQGKLAPAVNRGELAQSIGCWTLFWPASP